MPKLSSALMEAARTVVAEEATDDFPVPVPSEVLPANGPGVPVAVDTETNGLYADDGARISTTSVAWVPDEVVRDEGRLLEAIRTGEGVVAYAFPFDQGVRDKPLGGWAARKYKGGQLDMFAQDDTNLSAQEWTYQLTWLDGQDLVYHNAKFDLEKLRVGTRHWTGLELLDRTTWDTQLACKEMWPLESTSLKPTAQRLWGYDEGAEQRALKRWLGPKTDPRFDLVPWNVLGPYATKDAELTIRLYWWQQLVLADGGCPPEWVHEALEYMRVLYLMEKRGLPFDVAGSLDAATRIEEVKASLARELPFEPGVNQAKRYYFGSTQEGGLGRIPYEVTEKGEPALNEDVIRRLEADGAPHIETYARWRKLDTANSMWYRAYAEMTGEDGRLRTCFRQTHVKSGRISVERFQAQALPHEGKLRLLPEGVPAPRLLFPFPNGWEVDLAQAELRVAAQKAKCTSMIEMIVAGEDLHGVTATELFGSRKGDPDWFDVRQVAKRGNFSFIFGVGWKKFRDTVRQLLGIEFSEAEAKDIVAKWNRLYPEYRRAIHQFSDFALRNKYVPLANGKRRWFADHELMYGAHQAFNQYVQPSLAELAKDWTIDTERRHPGVLVMTVHDSQYLDLPADWDEAGSQRVASDVADRAAELGTEMFGIVMEAEYSKWGAH